MKYNFTEFENRKNRGSRKWDIMVETCPDLSDDVIPYSVADMEINTPPEILEGLKKQLNDTILGYPSLTEQYRSTVVDWMKRRYNFSIEKDWIIETQGIVPAIFAAVHAFSEVGDHILIQPPVYGPFFYAVEFTDRVLERSALIRENGRYQMDFEDFERRAKNPKTKLFILCNPHNPIGRVWTREELEKISKICLENEVMVVSDEIHADIIMPGHTFTSYGALSDEAANHSVICTAPSKTFNVAGLYTSNILIKNRTLRQKFVETATKYCLKGCNILGLKACEIAYSECDDWLDELIHVIDANRKIVSEVIDQQLPKIHRTEVEGTFLQWLDFNEYGLSEEALDRILRESGQLMLSDGLFFGEEGRGCRRLNIGCPTAKVEEAMNRLVIAMKEA